MLENILKSVTEAEEKAEEIVAKAEAEALEVIDEARKMAAVMKSEAIEKLKQNRQEFANQMKKMNTQMMGEAAEASARDVEALKISIISKREEAVRAVKEMLI